MSLKYEPTSDPLRWRSQQRVMDSGLVGCTRREDDSSRKPPRVAYHQVYTVYEEKGARACETLLGTQQSTTHHARLLEVLNDLRTVYIDGTAKVNSLSLKGN
jgi:hypothetical protein